MRFDDRAAVVALARQAEDLGYQELYSYDHIGGVDPFVPLCVAASATLRLRVGPLVLNNELHHPALLARTAATVDRLTGGRLVLGLGTGYAQSEHDAIGVPLRPPPQRVDRFGESLAALRELLDTGQSHQQGTHHQLALDRLGVQPLQARIPFLIGGHGRRVVRLGGRYADIFQFTGLADLADGSLDLSGFNVEAIVERGRWLSDAAGDRDGDIERSLLVQMTHVGDRADEHLAAANEEYHLPIDVFAESPFVLAGSLEQVVDKLERLRETLGVSHVVVRDAEGFAPVVAALSGR
jgi:probable F420-dependent oxidoreductase